MTDATGELVDDDAGLADLMRSAETLAVIGMKPPGGGPAWSVPAYMRGQGYRTIAVNPGYDDIGGQPLVDTVEQIEEAVDMVVVFRRSRDVVDHVDEILAMDPPPRSVWMQLGIRNSVAARRLTEAGIDVVQSRCLAIEHPRLLR